MDQQQEWELVRRAQRGDQDAFEALAAESQNTLFSLVFRMVGSRPDAEDACQEALLSAWKGLPNFRGEARFSTWLYRLGVNAAQDVLRRRGKEQGNQSLDGEDRPLDVPDPGPTPQDAAEESIRRRALYQAVEQLSEEHRRILCLREFAGLSYDEIALALELSPGTVRSRLARARNALRETLERDGNFFAQTASNEAERG